MSTVQAIHTVRNTSPAAYSYGATRAAGSVKHLMASAASPVRTKCHDHAVVKVPLGGREDPRQTWVRSFVPFAIGLS